MFNVHSSFKKKALIEEKKIAQMGTRRSLGKQPRFTSLKGRQVDRIKDIHDKLLIRTFTEFERIPDSVVLKSEIKPPKLALNIAQAINIMNPTVGDSKGKSPGKNGTLKTLKKLSSKGCPKSLTNVPVTISPNSIPRSSIPHRPSSTCQVNVQFNNLHIGITGLTMNQEQEDKNIERFGFHSRLGSSTKDPSTSIGRSGGFSPKPSRTQTPQELSPTMGHMSEFKCAATRLLKVRSGDFLEPP